MKRDEGSDPDSSAADPGQIVDVPVDAGSVRWGRPTARMLVLSCFAPATPIPAWLLQLPPLAALLTDRRRLLGDDHPDTLTSRATLARLAARQGRRGEAEELYRQVIADRSRVLGSGHPDTAAVRDEFARLAAG